VGSAQSKKAPAKLKTRSKTEPDAQNEVAKQLSGPQNTTPTDKQRLSQKASSQILVRDVNGSLKLSKTQVVNTLTEQEEEIKVLIDKLGFQVTQDELAALRFLGLRNMEYVRLGLKKRKYHEDLLTKLAERLTKTKELLQQISNSSLKESVMQNIDKTTRLCTETREELQKDYIANSGRPNVDLSFLHDELEDKGYTDEMVVENLNTMWMQCLADSAKNDDLIKNKGPSEEGLAASCLEDSEIMTLWKEGRA